MAGPSVITIGNFDGVHVGHRAIFQTARELARERSARVIAMTFDPHPNATLDPAHQPPRLCPLEQKLKRLKDAGADEVIVLNPEPKLLGQTPQEFVRRVVEQHRPVAFVEGADFRFGHARAGDLSLLKHLGTEYGFEVITQPSWDVTLTDLGVVTVRSSVVRWLVGHGRVEDAARCLGEPFTLTSKVVHGEHRGKSIGIPTANLDLDTLDDHMLPADGVYVGYAHSPGVALGEGADRTYTAAISVGNKPSFGHVKLTIEAHLLDFDADLYGQPLALAFTHWIRDQQRFPTPEALCEQLARDIEYARNRHTACQPLTPNP